MNLGSVASQGDLDLHLNSRHTWQKACSFASQSAFFILQELTFPLKFTFDGNEKQNRSRTLILKDSSKKLPDNCNHSWRCGFSVSLATDILFTKCPPGSEAAGLSAGANGPIPQAKCYSRR